MLIGAPIAWHVQQFTEWKKLIMVTGVSVAVTKHIGI